mgnify:CR=1 FL=1
MCNTNLKLMKLADELFKSALFFNKIMDGKNLVDDRGDLLFGKHELAEKINMQYLIALEEVKETETALKENDIVEVYDGYCDVFYTCDILFYMLDLYEQEYGFDGKSACKHFNNDGLGILVDKYDELMGQVDNLDIDILSEYADRVIENNMEKFTTDEAVFKTWKSEYIQTSKVVDGVTYYFFTDENGKVKKRSGFPKVEVGGLFNEAK